MAYNPPTINTVAPFGNLPKSGEENPMTDIIGSFQQSIDGTGTAENSPLSVNGTSFITVPKGALMVFLAATSAFNVTEDSTATAYFTVPANTIYRYDCFKLSKVYLNTGSSIAISFQFRMLV